MTDGGRFLTGGKKACPLEKNGLQLPVAVASAPRLHLEVSQADHCGHHHANCGQGQGDVEDVLRLQPGPQAFQEIHRNVEAEDRGRHFPNVLDSHDVDLGLGTGRKDTERERRGKGWHRQGAVRQDPHLHGPECSINKNKQRNT